MAHNWPRDYERVPDLDEIDKSDAVAVVKAKQQANRDR